MEHEIDPVSADSPNMDNGDFAAFKRSIAEIGQLVPIVAIGGKIIDGRKRYRACRELGKMPAIIDLPIGTDPATHAIALNVLRTHYTPSQRSVYAAKVATRKSGVKTQVTNFGHLPPTLGEAAKAAGVSRSMAIEAKAVLRDGIPEVAAAVERGDLTVHGAKEVTKVPKEEQPAALEQVLARPKARDGRRRIKPTSTIRFTKAKPSVHRLKNVLNSLSSAADTLATLNIETCRAAPAADVAQWCREIDLSLGAIRAFRRRLAAAPVYQGSAPDRR